MALVHIDNSVPGLVCAYGFQPEFPSAVLGDAEVVEWMSREDAWVWLHLNLTDWRCRRWLQETLSLDAEATARFADPPVRQAIGFEGTFLLGHIADFRQEFDRESTDFAWLHFLLGKRILLTARTKSTQSVEKARSKLRLGLVVQHPADLLALLIASYPDALDAALHRLMDELEQIEDQILDDRHRGERRRLMLVRRETAHIHRHMRALRRAITQADRNIESIPLDVSEISQRLISLDQDFEALEARARFFHDEIDAKLASETNRQLYILSALTAAFLPPALVAGLFGMNLEGIPFVGAAWGFWGALALSALSSGAVILFLRLNGRS